MHNNRQPAAALEMASTCVWLLTVLCSIQFLIILYLASILGHHENFASDSIILPVARPEKQPIQEITPVTQVSPLITQNSTQIFKGVAATLLLHSPTWFQRRYSVMVQNAVNNVPQGWKVQIFYSGSGQSKAGIDINKGLARLIESGHVILTLLPEHLRKRKRFELMMEVWLWENMLADKVFIFGGNSVICSNSPYHIENFIEFDYIGSPWDFKKGVGGDGGISIRNRHHMIAAINYELEKIDDVKKRAEAYKTWGQEDQFFVSRLLEMNKKGVFNSKLASRDDTLRFSAIGSYVNSTVLVASGTLPGITFEERTQFITMCPEIKMVYPSLHDPSCFGASPNGEKCAKTICALELPRRKGGC